MLVDSLGDVQRTAKSGLEVYRIAGEALRNAFRHAQARRIEVEIRYDERQLRLRVGDDGKGFDLDLESDGHGLSSIRSRSSGISARLQIISAPGHGTSITVEVPLTSAVPAAT